MAVETNGTKIVLSEREKKLLELIRKIGYGEISLLVHEFEPVLVEEAIKKIKL